MPVVTIHQPEHLPWLGFFAKVSQADVLVVLDCVQYRKNYFGNRNRLLGPNGPFWVNVPVHLRGHMEGTYADVGICNTEPWARRYWKSVYFNYKNHAYFHQYGPWMEAALGQTWERLASLNLHLIRGLLDALDLHPQILMASELGVEGSSTSLLVDLCRKTGASTYLAGQLGKNYMDEALFETAGIDVQHLHFEHPVYPQLGNQEFTPQLSLLDLLMNSGPQSLDVVRSGLPVALSQAT